MKLRVTQVERYKFRGTGKKTDRETISYAEGKEQRGGNENAWVDGGTDR